MITQQGQIKVWHPEKDRTGYLISHDQYGWLRGAYDSVQSALAGAELDIAMNPAFYEMQDRVNNVSRENRFITIDDLKGVKAWVSG